MDQENFWFKNIVSSIQPIQPNLTYKFIVLEKSFLGQLIKVWNILSPKNSESGFWFGNTWICCFEI